ncbi:Metallo-dependent phosphatase-like protein [Roridomyces roridus]|uniref:Metallo-dependent phosphatase-like protein n=1 Tax=Roridomyces roridus TaxID=1738132 RepID=A0AAD7C264_9AGAR|nr:Metallo-dependent phosphatase-like protein [Roridomyces roridus]
MPTLALPHLANISSQTAVVQLEYNTAPLPKPEDDSSPWTRFVLLSDTHSKQCAVPDGDVLIHTGDLTNRGTLDELTRTMEWFYALPHPLKIVIAGNHDLSVHREWYEPNSKQLHGGTPVPAAAVRELLKGPRAVEANIVYLEDVQYKFTTRDGGKEWSVYGSPWSPEFYFWAFGYKREDGKALVSKFPKTDILLTHGPPRNVLDITVNNERAGCDDLAARVQELKPRLHVFGHIHEAHGAYLHRWKPDAELGVQNAIQLGELVDEYGPVTNPPDEIAEDQNEESTVFVNAANWPAGPIMRQQAAQGGGPSRMGERRFQPVVVDLRE